MVAAVIVLYNPDHQLLERLLLSITGQVEKTFVIDNTPNSSSAASAFFAKYRIPIVYVPLGDNMGIAAAQNVGIQLSIEAGCSHVLLLDQDSALPAGAIVQLLVAEEHLSRRGKRVAAVGPLFLDEKNGKPACAVQHTWLRVKRLSVHADACDPVETDCLNASGSLICTTVFKEVGLMLEELFIDAVDTEWCMRCKSKGFSSYIVPNVTMVHNIGDMAVSILGREITLHGDIRNYYIIRNATYLLRLRTMGYRWRISNALSIPKYGVLYSLLSGHIFTSISMLLTALRDGLIGKTGRFARK
jgi:rhamnosyltransferase